jgi:hypothetical protein
MRALAISFRFEKADNGQLTTNKPRLNSRMQKPSTANLLNCVLALACLVSFASMTPAQTSQTLSGVIVDSQFAVLRGARLTLRQLDGALEREQVSDEKGEFAFALLPAGVYRLRVHCEGFSPVEIDQIVLVESAHQALRIQMAVAALDATVQVTAQRETPKPETTPTRQFMPPPTNWLERLPLNGQTLQPLITLAPGVVTTKATVAEQGQFAANGQRANANYFTVEGVSANTGLTATNSLGQAGSLPGLSATGGTQSLATLGSVQEVRVQTHGYAAEFGRMPGAQVALVTRTGTRDWHGNVFETFRHHALAANDWFANRNGAPRAALRQHNAAAALSGPLRLPLYDGRDHTHFFAAYETLRLRQPLFAETLVPSLRARDQAPALLKSIVAAYPLPNGDTLTDGLARLATGYTDPTRLDAASLRLDHVLNNRHTVFVRLHFAPSQVGQREESLSGVTTTAFAHRSLTLGATQSFSSALAYDLRFNFAQAVGRSEHRFTAFGGAVVPTSIAGLPLAGLMTIDTLGLAPLVSGSAADNRQGQFNIVNQLSLASTAHQFKFGVDYRRLTPRTQPNASAFTANFFGIAGAENFPAPAGTLLSGRAASVQMAARDAVGFTLDQLSLYAQDAWRIAPRFTLSYGLRWEINQPLRGTTGAPLYSVIGWPDETALALTDAATTQTLAGFAPRLGLAWQLAQAGQRTTTLRAGFGLFYDTGAGTLAANSSAYPYFRHKSLFGVGGVALPLTNSQLAAPVFSAAPPYGSFDVLDSSLALPRTQQWHLVLEQSFDAHNSLSLAYVGNAGRALLRREALRVNNPAFLAPLYVTRNAAESDYHALQVQYQRRLAAGWQAQASYTWSHALDLASNDSAPLTPVARLDARLDRGAADFDIRHAATAALSYALPGALRGWTADALLRVQTATPLNVTYASDIGFGFYDLRPDAVAGAPFFIADTEAPGGRRLNLEAFRIVDDARQGTLARNALRGFPFQQIDFALQRRFQLRDRWTLAAKAEVFNLFNHANFADASGRLNESTTGAIYSLLNRGLGRAGRHGGLNPVYQIGGPRVIQLSVKLSW